MHARGLLGRGGLTFLAYLKLGKSTGHQLASPGDLATKVS